MKGDLCDAAFRLLTATSSRVTTHQQKPPQQGAWQVAKRGASLFRKKTKDADLYRGTRKGRPISLLPGSPVPRLTGKKGA